MLTKILYLLYIYLRLPDLEIVIKKLKLQCDSIKQAGLKVNDALAISYCLS